MARTLSAYQARAQLDVTVCSTNWRIPDRGEALDNSTYIEGGVTYRYFQSWTPLLISLSMNKWFQINLKLFDIVHIHGLYRFPVTSAAWWARKTKVPFLIRPHGSLDPFLFNQSRYNLLLKRIYERLFDLPNLNHADAVHYSTEEEAKRAAFLKLRSKSIVVPNGIDWENFNCLPAKGSFRRFLKIDAKTPLVLFLGRINFAKGLDLLILSFALVARQNPDARLAVVGPDNEGYRTKVRHWCKEQKVQDKVFFVDHLGLKMVKEAYVDSDVFVLTSYTESFGLTVVEAMASETPVIISDQVKTWREVQRAGAGIMVNLDPVSVSTAINLLLSNQAKAKSMGLRGRAAAKELYAWPCIVDQLTQAYMELIEEKKVSNVCR
ncbi:MAG: glycosyltransferase [Deltaproteobacteria bacterium]|nr:glycosyltransferase [Deltaproteobacteria bacterium]